MTARRLGGALLLAAWIGGCAVDGAPRAPEEGGEVAAVDPGAVTALPEPLSDEAVDSILSGEYLGAEGDLQAAAEAYLEAALRSRDPQVAERATRVAFAAGSLQQAAMAADRWALLAPENVAAHESAATAMLRLGDYLGAEYPLERILDVLDDSGDAWLLVSRILAQSEDPAQAADVLSHLATTRTDADPGDVLFARSKLALQGRALEDAFEFARRSVELHPERVDFLTWAGRVALQAKLTPTGIEYVRRAWRLEPENRDLALAYADLLARDGQFDEAREVMSGIPESPEVMLSRILFELSAQNRVEAERLFEAFDAVGRDDPDTQAFYRAQAAEALGRTQQAIVLYGQVGDGEHAVTAALRQAELLGQEGDLDAARASLDAIRRGGDPAAVEQAWLTEARVLREAGLREEALAALDTAVARLPASINLLYSRALLAAELRRVEAAERDLRVVIAEQPDNAAALNALGYTLADLTDRYEEAEVLIRRAYQLQPNEPSIIDSMGWVAYRLGRLEEAVRFLARAWELDRNPEIAAHLGEVLWFSDRRGEAMAIWRQGAEVDADNPVLQATLDRLGVTL